MPAKRGKAHGTEQAKRATGAEQAEEQPEILSGDKCLEKGNLQLPPHYP